MSDLRTKNNDAAAEVSRLANLNAEQANTIKQLREQLKPAPVPAGQGSGAALVQKESSAPAAVPDGRKPTELSRVTLQGFTNSNGLQASADLSRLVAVSTVKEMATVWELSSGIPLFQRRGTSGTLGCSLAPDGQWVAIPKSGKVEVWDVSRGHLVNSLPVRLAQIRMLPGKRLLVRDSPEKNSHSLSGGSECARERGQAQRQPGRAPRGRQTRLYQRPFLAGVRQ